MITLFKPGGRTNGKPGGGQYLTLPTVEEFQRCADQRDEANARAMKLEQELQEVKARAVSEWASHNETVISMPNFWTIFASGIAAGVVVSVLAGVAMAGAGVFK